MKINLDLRTEQRHVRDALRVYRKARAAYRRAQENRAEATLDKTWEADEALYSAGRWFDAITSTIDLYIRLGVIASKEDL